MTAVRAVVISGLRRSGTTAVWACFREPGILAFDEPFHHDLAAGARINEKDTWFELADWLEQSGVTPVGIAPEAELAAAPTAAEIAYMTQLTEAAPRVAMDLVRAWNRVPALYVDPDRVLTVQLIRDPRSWVTAHMIPTGEGTWRQRLGKAYRQMSFFTRCGFYDSYFYETIVSAALAEAHPIWRSVTMPLAELRQAPAYLKLLAFWWGTNLASHQALAAVGARRVIVTLEELSADPKGVLKTIQVAAGWQDQPLGHAHMGRPGAAFAPGHGAWRRGAAALGLPPALLAPGGATAAALGVAFDQALAAGQSAR